MADINFQGHIQDPAPEERRFENHPGGEAVLERAKTVTVTPLDLAVAAQFREEVEYPTKPVEVVAKIVAALTEIKAQKGETFGL